MRRRDGRSMQRKKLRKQLFKEQYHRATPDTPWNIGPDDNSAFTDAIFKNTTAESFYEADTTQQLPRQSGRDKWKRKNLHKHKADAHTSTDKLGVYPVEGIGNGLFAKQEVSIRDRLICVYNGRKISRKKAYAKHNTWNYIIEVLDHYDLPLSIDGCDESRGVCYNNGGYANNTIGWEGDQGRWSA